MKSIGAAFLRPDALPGVNHMRGIKISDILYCLFYLTLFIDCNYNVCFHVLLGNIRQKMTNTICLH